VARRLAEAGVPAAVESHAVLASTNDTAATRARAGAPEWTCVLAGLQTAGRGRQGRSWDSRGGSLYLSVLLRPRGDARWSLLPLAAGVAVAEALGEAGVGVRLKWPNDVMAAGRKLGGILVESAWTGAGTMDTAVVGIGVNLAGGPDDRPLDLSASAISVEELVGQAPTVEDTAVRTVARLALWYDRLAAGGAAAVRDAWRERALPWWGRTVEARSGGSVLRGVARGIDDDGALLLERPDGSALTLRSAEVHAVRAEQGS
jgi:BirA family biotin operon repressor/biotin-[acetyl-CoA-carboxylase] ligase